MKVHEARAFKAVFLLPALRFPLPACDPPPIQCDLLGVFDRQSIRKGVPWL